VYFKVVALGAAWQEIPVAVWEWKLVGSGGERERRSKELNEGLKRACGKEKER